MTLAAGSRLGPYEVLAPLGAGGMGEVYRAKDTKLDRQVALKVLPERLADDAAALARFEREAKAVAALSHPNILAIHDFGRQDGTAYAVMELLEGETLRARLSEGALPVRKAIDFAAQIARGLAAAHDKGIVHRDLKPENVFVASDGRVNILDFGLARVALPQAEDTQSPTVAAATEPGTVMGTVGYMSPEQVRGLPADHRSDIFSFGSVLFEMATGERAFRGASAAETLAAIAQKDPPGLSGIDDSLAPALDRIVRHCLEKSPSERFQSARDLAFDLEMLSATSGPARALEAPRTRKRGTRLAWLVVAALAAAVGAGLGWLLRGARTPRDRPQPALSFSQITGQPGVERRPSLSPDGKSVAYVGDVGGNADIYLLRIGGHNPINLTPDSPLDDTSPAFSPDGSEIAFRSERQGGGIFIMGATGESVRRVTDFGFDPAWSPNGKEIAVSTLGVDDPYSRGSPSQLFAVEVSSGRRRLVSEGDAVQPSWSPHGSRIAYWGYRRPTTWRDLWTAAADGSEAKGKAVSLTNDAPLDWDPVWSPDGRHLYFSSDRGGSMNLWRISIDERSGSVQGEAEAVTTPALWASDISVSRDGRRLVYIALDRRTSLERADFDPVKGALGGSHRTILRGSHFIGFLDWSPRGDELVFATRGIRENLYVIGLDGGGYRQLTDDSFRNRGPRWSPQGTEIAFSSNRGGPYRFWTIRTDGSNLKQWSELSGLPVWSPDGRLVVLRRYEGGHVVDLTAGRESMPLPKVRGAEALIVSSWSPDGTSLVGIASSVGMVPSEIYSYSLARRTFRNLGVSGLNPIWMPDSRRILFDSQSGLFLLDTQTGQTQQILQPGTLPTGIWQKFALSPDGRRLAFLEPYEEGDLWMMTLPSAKPAESR